MGGRLVWRFCLTGALLLFLWAGTAPAGGMWSSDLRTTEGVRSYHEVPMTDGTLLGTDVYLPDESGGPWPVVLIRSTYGRNFNMNGFLRSGCAAVVHNIRGMHGSGGEAHVFFTDGWRPGLTDGADTIAWIRSQPWCNGKVATTGESALAMTQMLMAPTTDGVAAQYVSLVPSNYYYDVVYHGGVFRKNLVEGWLTLLGQYHVSELYRSHPLHDDFWNYYNVVARAKDITTPALFMNGWYDIFGQGTIEGFLSREKDGGEGARGQNYLIMRWSTHNDDKSPDYRLNDNRGSLNIGEIRDKFFARHLKGDLHAMDGVAKVHYYVMGDDRDPDAPGNEWRTAETWPPYPTVDTPFYLSGDGALVRGECPNEEKAFEYSFDPKKPVPTLGGANLLPNLKAGPYDQRKISNRPDILKFTTPVLEEPLETVGRIRVTLFVSSDAPDTDFTAKLVDVFPDGDGREINVLDGIRRVKTRDGYDKAAPLLTGPDQVVQLDIDLWTTAWVFNKGHRIALHVSSSNYPRFDVNNNTGADHPEPGAEMRTALNRVHCGGVKASALYLPVGK